ncbi:winged helix DNA-binding domain-containing protein [Amycolatopsis echigonensis]|uniref:AlkZ family DNA glycosylase n=1 Tax=Amycolatopsis echigonensis TaxID=2576905 RepID=A0A2N3WID2_9PSEU|nr:MULTISPECIES: winged helix DNA-binding domain-containing protein [Amycolatopsis]MBB2499396.1 AlkZ family DNA glycosylase [Amycolatopsis echigonensis]PKV93611.1 winged helix DNA-binding protein [Amycolatopsis niigatensis]
MAQVLGRRELGRALLARQWLLERADATVEEAVTRLVGMQAQAPYAPYFGLWSRLRTFGTADLADALTERRLVRVALMRSTIHLVTTADYRSLRPWAQPALDRELNTAFKTPLTGLDRAAVAESGRALLDARHLTPKELGAALHERWPDREPHALATVVRNLVPLVQVPPRAVWGVGGTTRYATAAGWTGAEPDPAADSERIVLRYLAAFGPASVADVQTWAGRTRLRPVLERLRPHLAVFRDEHRAELFDLPDAPRPGADAPAPVRFLPEYDNLLASHADRGRVISAEARKRVMTRNGKHATILVDGQVTGAWKLDRAKASATLEIDLFRPLTAAERAEVEAEGTRLLKFAAPGASHDLRMETLADRDDPVRGDRQ